MRYDWNKESKQTVIVKGVKCQFTDERIIRETIPTGKHVYEVRHDDDGLGEPAQVKDYILVNFLGTLVSDEPIPFDEHGYCWIEDADWQWTRGEDDE